MIIAKYFNVNKFNQQLLSFLKVKLLFLNIILIQNRLIILHTFIA
jgi:hypothetical protein